MLFRIGLVVALLCVFGLGPVAYADEASEQIQSQIDALKQEIAQLQADLNSTTQQKQTLQSAVKSLDLQIQKLQASITLTNTQIKQKDKEITQLGGSITTTEGDISLSEAGVAESLRQLDMLDGESLVTVLLGGGTLSAFFDEAVSLSSLRNELGNRIEDLTALKGNLVNTKTSAETKRRDLAALHTQLSQQKQGLSVARTAQSDLLKQTQNKESNYQALIAQKKAEQTSFEQALIKLSAGLGYTFDPSNIPPIGSGILQWPLDSVRVTQTFGNTAFAKSGAYSGSGHNGIDFRASIGTPVRASMSGTVAEINQGSVKNCQYGKWVLMTHNNGLATLYAHLSSINVQKGDVLTTGQVLGLSGDTGYATGPHLHMTVYAAQAVSYKQYTCVSGYTVNVPIVPLNAYLNPLSYLPAL